MYWRRPLKYTFFVSTHAIILNNRTPHPTHYETPRTRAYIIYIGTGSDTVYQLREGLAAGGARLGYRHKHQQQCARPGTTARDAASRQRQPVQLLHHTLPRHGDGDLQHRIRHRETTLQVGGLHLRQQLGTGQLEPQQLGVDQLGGRPFPTRPATAQRCTHRRRGAQERPL